MADIRTIRVQVDGTQDIVDIQRLQQQVNQTAGAYQNLSNTLRNSTTAAVSESDKFLASLKRQAEQIGKTRAEILEMNAARLGVSSQASAFIAKVKEQEEALKKLGHSAGGVNSELFVLAHELSQGNFKDFGGSLMVLAQQSGGITGALRGVGALITPFTAGLAAVAASAAILAVAFYKGNQEAKEFNNTLALTNNVAGLTTSTFANMAETVAGKTNSSIGSSKEVLMDLAKTGKFTSDQMLELAPSIINFAKLSGESLEDAVKHFQNLSREPLKTATELDASMNFLSAGQLEQIKRYEAMGDKASAARIASEALSKHFNTTASEALKDQVHWYTELNNKLSQYWNNLKEGISGNEPDDKKLRNLQERRRVLQATVDNPMANVDEMGNPSPGRIDGELGVVEAQIDELQKKIKAKGDKAKADAAQALVQTLGKDANAFISPFLDKVGLSFKDRMDNWDKQIENYRAALAAKGETDSRMTAANIAKARQLYAESIKDPLADRNNKKLFNDRISNLDESIQTEDQLFQTRIAMIRAAQQAGYITLDESITREHAAKMEDLAEDIKYTQKKLELAQARIKAAPWDEEATGKLREVNRAMAKLQSDQLIENANYNAKLAEQANQTKAVYNKLALDIQKSQGDRTLQINRDLSRTFLTTNEAAIFDTIASVDEKYKQLRERTQEDFRARGKSGTQAETDALALIETARQEDLIREQQYLNDKLLLQQDWKDSAIKSLKEYADQAKNTASLASNAINGILGSLEDSFANFFATGKFGFKDFVNSINREFARIAARQVTGLIAQGLGSFLPSLFSARADGGEVLAGSSYLVGERGPELFTSTTNGMIIPNHTLVNANSSSNKSSGTISINVGGISIQGSGNLSMNDAQKLQDRIKRTIITVIQDEQRSGGILSN